MSFAASLASAVVLAIAVAFAPGLDAAGTRHALAGAEASAGPLRLAEVQVPGTPDGRGPDPLIGPRWRLVAMGETPVEAEGQREPPHIVFDPDGGLFGSGGCNRLRSSWEHDAYGVIRFGQAASTMMACPDPAMRVERAFFEMLAQVSAYRVADGRLTLIAEGAPLAEFEAKAAE